MQQRSLLSKGGLAATLLFAQLGHSSPVPQDISVIGFGSTEQICGVTYENPDQAWRNSGAAHFLDTWLSEHGENNWAYEMDRLTTDGGSQGTAVLNCRDFDVGNCDFPTVLCRYFTPPELWHVRKAMATAYGILKALFNSFERSILKQHLDAGSIISDFGPADSSVNIFGVLNGAFTVAAGAAAASNPVTGSLTMIAGIFGVLASQSSDTVDLSAEIDGQLSAALTKAEDQTRSLLELIFAGRGDTSTLPGASQPGSNAEKTNIGRFFSGGKFLVDITSENGIDSMIRPLIEGAATRLRQRLVSSVLKAQDYYIFVDTTGDESRCTDTGSRFIDGECYSVHHFQLIAGGKGYGQSRAIDAGKILKFDDPNAKYNFDVVGFYRNANDCQNAHPGFDGDMGSSGFPTDGSLPQCFFNLPVIRGRGTPCEASNIRELPGNLGINDGSCTPNMQDICRPRPGMPNPCL